MKTRKGLPHSVNRFFHYAYKLLIGPLKYGKGNDYDAGKYWHDRFSKYGLSFRGVGHEGLSEEDNRRMYGEAASVFVGVCQREQMDFGDIKALDIGCGNGFYTQLLRDLGVNNYTGLDITDVLFPELKKRFPTFRFIRKDITSERIEGKYDLIIMIDVIEHIVKENRLSFCMENVKNCLSNDGVFILAPIMNTSRKSLFYVRSWSLEDVKHIFAGYVFGELIPFRGNNIVSIKRRQSE